MSVADLAREMARRYVDTQPIADWARMVLERLGVPATATLREPAHLEELVAIWRRVLEAAFVEHLTIPELRALTQFYSTTEGASAMRKTMAFQEAITPVLVAEILAWARAVTARVRPQPSAGEGGP